MYCISVNKFCRNFKSLVQTVCLFCLRPRLSILVLTQTMSPPYHYRGHCQNQVLSWTTLGKLSRHFFMYSYRRYYKIIQVTGVENAYCWTVGSVWCLLSVLSLFSTVGLFICCFYILDRCNQVDLNSGAVFK